MKLRSRALFATSALLYSGPLYAGLAGYGFETIPLFALLFMVWLQIVRPGDWPETAAEWRNPRALAWPLLILAAQMVVVGLLLAVARGIGGVYDLTLPLPFVFTFFVSFLAIALARLLRRGADLEPRAPGQDLGFGAGILDVGTPAIPGRLRPGEFVEAALSLAADLGPKGAPAEATDILLEQVEATGTALPVLDALDDLPGSLTVVQMQARLALRPKVALAILGEGRIGRAVSRALASRDAALMEQTGRDLRKLLGKSGDLAEELPHPRRLRSAAEEISGLSPAAADALRGLATDLEAAGAVRA